MVLIAEKTGKSVFGARPARPPASRILEEILGCKWTLAVLGQIRQGTCRPGMLVRNISGLSTKVLNERLSKLVRFGVLERTVYPVVPPKVEYRLSRFGAQLIEILDAIDRLQADLGPAAGQRAEPPKGKANGSRRRA